jgi:hypothetical protein
MARTSKADAADDGLNIPQSTGNVEFDATPEERTQAANNTSTGNVEHPGEITVTQGYLNDPISVNVQTPSEPVTVTASFLTDAQRKVVVAQHAAATGAASEVAETKDAGEDAKE